MHRIASLIKRWLLGTHQGSVDTAHLTSYLNEFVFRFNRRRSRSRGMVFYRVLELAVAHDPVRYRDLIVDPTPKMKPPERRREPVVATQPAWNARRRTDHGELPARRALAPVKWIPQTFLFATTMLAFPIVVLAQSDQTYATYITEEQWQMVNELPGVDRQIVSRAHRQPEPFRWHHSPGSRGQRQRHGHS